MSEATSNDPTLIPSGDKGIPLPNPTLLEASQHKEDLENAIEEALTKFGKLTGLSVEGIFSEVRGIGHDSEGNLRIAYTVEVGVEL